MELKLWSALFFAVLVVLQMESEPVVELLFGKKVTRAGVKGIPIVEIYVGAVRIWKSNVARLDEDFVIILNAIEVKENSSNKKPFPFLLNQL